MDETERIIEIVTSGNPEQQSEEARDLAGRDDISLSALIPALVNPVVRRWARTHLLERLSHARATELAERFLDWPEDFDPQKWDRSTTQVVFRLTDDRLERSLPLLAGSNAAGAVWERFAASGTDAVMAAARSVFQQADVPARETTLHFLALDPYGHQYLSRADQDELLFEALDDPDTEIRGLAAEVVAADHAQTLLERSESAPLDSSERVRMAYWRAALTHQPDRAIEAAGALALNLDQPLEARRTALLALGENVSTRTVSPVLQSLMRDENQTLAEDAAQLMWRRHRAPDIANAASESQFDSVRDLAERLLHPERGSPAAGGSRPGDPMRTAEIFDQFRSANNSGTQRPEPDFL